MKIKIIPSPLLTIEVDGKQIGGSFRIESEWEGFLKLVSNAPRATIIVQKPPAPKNPYDFISTVFGGGQAPLKTESIEAEVISASPDLIPKI